MQGIHIILMLDEMHMLRRFPDHANRLIMPTMADVHDFVSVTYKTQDFSMHLADQGARRIHDIHPASARLFLNGRRDAMSGKHHRNPRLNRIIRYLIQLVYEHRTLACELIDNMPIMNDLPAHIYGWNMAWCRFRTSRLQNGSHCEYRSIHTGTKPSWIRQYYALIHTNRHSHIPYYCALPAIEQNT
ncbi:hypothetical protein BITS_1796 [Bifidobacterium tsurumiense]|uniref:Uncharacterized protein n=1 Tax=Bifidobacterium tsurumiense TaxID=356829 RepID=A0A087EDE1_9BIFI|nr:hypothetical protein BITS_1796 [Bifidobacterium tsurumiense]